MHPFSGLIGMGSISLLSIRFGEKDNKGASHIFSNTLSLIVIVMTIVIISIAVNLNGILSLFGAEADVLDQARQYMNIILFGSIFQVTGHVLSGAVRTEGHPRLSMIAMSSSAVANIIFDFIFIVLFKWGVKGAALGTVIGQFAGLSIVLSFYIKGNSSLVLKAKDFVPDFKVIRKIFSIGFASFMGTIGTSVSMTLLSRSLAVYGGTAAVASMGAINSLFTMVVMPIFGIQEGMQPIMGYNYGANQINRSYKTLKIGLLIASAFSVIVFFALEIIPGIFVGMFLNSGSNTFTVAVKGLRIAILMLPLLCINFMGITFFQSIGNGKISAVLGMQRSFLFLIPALLILPKIFGLTGVWLTMPVADFLSIAITSLALVINYKKHKADKRLAIGEEIYEHG
jgi:putative MATE family efflux protein